MNEQIKTYTYPGGEQQRVQLVRLRDWSQLQFMQPPVHPRAIDGYAHIYRQYLIPACPWIFGDLVLFRLPADVQLQLSPETASRLTAAAELLQKNVRVAGGKPRFRTKQAQDLYMELEKRDCIRIVSGRLPVTQFIPVADRGGLLSEAPGKLKVNASFFIMDPIDCATVHDHVGTPLGLCVKDGEVKNPPLFGREALLVKKSGDVTVEPVDVKTLTLRIGGKTFRHGENALIFSRPKQAWVAKGGRKLVIVGSSVAAVTDKRRVKIPASGFVLQLKENVAVSPGEKVEYLGMEDVAFGIQVGNSIVRGGVATEKFISRFYNIRRLEPVPFPPSLYPMDFAHARAARIALGADKAGKPMLLWAEGAPKSGYVPGEHSCGASLREMAAICRDLGIENAVNLDGGGSAQLILDGVRSLQLSDRNPDGSQAERAVPLALAIY